MSNPTEKAPSSLQPPASGLQDPAWIRDVQAATIGCIFESLEKVAEMCEGEKNFCELCGAEFPLWPVSEWATHYVEAHKDVITLQQQQAVLAFCTAGLTEATKHFMSMQLVTRRTIRRRAYELGMTRFVDADGKFVEKEPTRIIQ